jgi:hypothetical protein
MIKSDLEQLARTIAAKHSVPPEILCGMLDRESTDSPWAVRYEPGFLARYVMPQYKAGKIDLTETYTRAMSWGPLQIMGQTAREFGFDGKYLTELCDPPVGIEWGCRKLAACLKRTDGNIDAALEMYNGGANPNYAGEVSMCSIQYRTQTVTKL